LFAIPARFVCVLIKVFGELPMSLLNPIESFVEKKKQEFIQKFLSADLNHDGHPDFEQAVTFLQGIATKLGPLASKVTEADLVAAMTKVNHEYLSDKFSPAELQTIVTVGEDLVKAEQTIVAALPAAQKLVQ
jgi:hypothetical protein